MFGARRPPPKAPPGASPAAAARPATGNNTTLAVPRGPTTGPSSPLSSVPSSSPRAPAITTTAPGSATTTTTTKRPVPTVRTAVVTRTVVQRVVQPARAPAKPQVRTLNAYKRPADAPPLAGAPAAKRAVNSAGSAENGKSPAGGSSRSRKGSDSSVPGSTGGTAARRRASDPSSDLDPLTPSEEEGEDDDSDLSSVDEDYFSKTLAKEEGAPVCARDVAATGEGSTEGKSGESLVLENRAAYKEREPLLAFPPFLRSGGAGANELNPAVVHPTPDFLDPRNPEGPTSAWAGSDVPTIELEYPGVGVKER